MIDYVLRLGSKGSLVKAMQSALGGLKIDGIFGPETDRRVREFQRGQGIAVDGLAGPITLSKLYGPLSSAMDMSSRASSGSVSERAVILAKSFVGHKETSPNSSILIDEWLKDLGINYPAPWCLAFVQAMVKEACVQLGVEDVLKPDTAHCMTLWNAWKAKGKTVNPMQGRRGDIAIFHWGGGAGHTGIVESYKDGYYTLIEGNTNSAGDREGDGVALKKRYKYNDKLVGFIRLGV